MGDKLSTNESSEKKRPRYHRIRFWLSVATGILVVAGITVLTLLPFVMEWGAEYMLLHFGAKKATISNIDFNPMTGHLGVFDLRIQGPNDDRITMERLIVKIDPFPIFRKKISFREISLSGFSLDIRQLEDGTIKIGGLSIPEQEEAGHAETEIERDAWSWGLGLENLDIEGLTINLFTPNFSETVVLDHINLKDIETWTPEKTGGYVLKADLLGGTVVVEGTARPFIESMEISAKIELENLSLERLTPYIKNTSVESLSGSVSGQGMVNATLNLNSTLAAASVVQFNVSVKDISLQTASERFVLEFQTEALDIGVSLDSSIDTGESAAKEASFAVTTTLDRTILRLANNKADFEVLQDALSAEVSGSYSDTGSVDLSQFSAKAGLSLQGLILMGGRDVADLIRLGSLDIAGIEINGVDDIRTSLIQAADTALIPRLPQSVGKGEPEQTFYLKYLEITGISLSDRSHLAVETVQMDSLNTWILWEREGGFEALRIVQGIMDNPTVSTPVESQPVDIQVEEPHLENSVVIDVGKFSITGKNNLAFKDLSVDPPFNFSVNSLSGEILNLSSGEKGVSTEITINAGSGKYSAMSVKGTIQPPWDTPDVDLHIHMKGFELPPMTPYSKNYLGYIIHSGRLDTEIDILVEKGIMNGQAVVLVNRIEMEEIEDEQRTEEYLDIPIKTALSMLKDKNDNINLTLPIEGDMKDPAFNITEIVAAATGQALKKGASIYYKDLGVTLLSGGLIPPGAYTLSGELFKDTTTMKFDPVIFNPLSRKLTKPAKEYLDLLAEKLSEKPKVRLVLCGQVAKDDIFALRPGDTDTELASADNITPKGTAEGPEGADLQDPATLEETVPADSPIIEMVSLNQEERTHLIEITRQRALAVKDHLSENGGIDPERLFICNPDVELVEEGQPPRVDLSI